MARVLAPEPFVKYLVRDERELRELQKNYELFKKYCEVSISFNESFNISISREFSEKDPKEYVLIDSSYNLFSHFLPSSKNKKVSKNISTDIVEFEEENLFFKIGKK